MTEEIKKKGRNLSGFECLMFSNLPMGAGISSSAALECGLAEGLNELFCGPRFQVIKLTTY